MRKGHDFWKILKIIPDPERCHLFFKTFSTDMEKALQDFKLFRTVTTLYDSCSSLTTPSLLHALPSKETNICSTRLEQHLRKCQNCYFPWSSKVGNHSSPFKTCPAYFSIMCMYALMLIIMSHNHANLHSHQTPKENAFSIFHFSNTDTTLKYWVKVTDINR